MADYISREAAKKILSSMLTDYAAECACNLIDSVLPADVEPVRHGRWEGYIHSRYCGMDEYGEPVYRDGTVYYCSNPKCRRKTVVKENYCPNCGAKMDLEDETDDGTAT